MPVFKRLFEPYIAICLLILLPIIPGTERGQALADIARSALCCHSNETRALIPNPCNSAELEGTPTIPRSYIWVRAVVWECGEGQTHRRRHRHTDGCDHYTFHIVYDSHET